MRSRLYRHPQHRRTLASALIAVDSSVNYNFSSSTFTVLSTLTRHLLCAVLVVSAGSRSVLLWQSCSSGA